MKHFVYLDTDLINSYLAQLNDGLIKSKQVEDGTEIKEEKTERKSPNKSGSEFGLSIPGMLEYKHKFDEGYSTELNTLSQTNAGKEVLSKMIHDNSYDDLIAYLSKENNIIEYNGVEDLKVADYISINGNLKMIDISVLTELMGEDFRNAYKLLLSGDLQNSIDRFENPDIKSSDLKDNQLKSKHVINKDLEMFKNVTNLINYISKLLPSEKYLVYQDILIPLDKKYLRENYNSLRYKYSSNSTIVGNITGNIKDIINIKPGNEFGEMFQSIDGMMLAALDMLSIKEDFKVMHPISWYY